MTQDEQEQPVPTEIDERAELDRKKRRILYYLLITVIANAIFDVLVGLPYQDFSFVIFATTGLAAFFAFAWVRLDARGRGIDFGALGIGIALLTKFTLPIYFIHSRGWRSGLIASLWTVLFIGLLILAYLGAVQLTLIGLAKLR
jgi:hypothetical protein